MGNTINESAIKKLKLLFTVVDRPKAEFYLDVLSQFEVNCQLITGGKGTATSELVDMFGITECLMPYACTGMDRKEHPVLFAYDLNMVNLRKFKNGLEMFEERGIVVCFEFQRKVLEEYFGELAEVVVIEMKN